MGSGYRCASVKRPSDCASDPVYEVVRVMGILLRNESRKRVRKAWGLEAAFDDKCDK